MGVYVKRHLVSDEHILYTAHYHWSVWLCPMTSVIMAVIITLFSWFCSEIWGTWAIWISVLILFVSVLYIGYWYVKFGFDEFAITNQRIFIKKGIFAHETTEHNVKKIETVSVEQGFVERMINRGTVTFSGTGSSVTKLSLLANPHEFRSAIQLAIDNSGRDNESIGSGESKRMLSRVEQIERLKNLYDNGTINLSEFEKEKGRILSD